MNSVENSELPQCLICLDSDRSENMHLLHRETNHFVHERCFRPWTETIQNLELFYKCPLCFQPIQNPERYTWNQNIITVPRINRIPPL